MSTSHSPAGRRAVVFQIAFAGMLLPALLSGQFLHSGRDPRLPHAWAPFNFDAPSISSARTETKETLVSADFLRHPLSSKAKRALLCAETLGNTGHHQAAIAELQVALDKFPKAAPYTHNLLGVEYAALKQYVAANREFEHVLEVMPHLSANHVNYGLTLAALGEDRQAEREFRYALILDATNTKAKAALDALLQPPAQQVPDMK